MRVFYLCSPRVLAVSSYCLHSLLLPWVCEVGGGLRFEGQHSVIAALDA